jgi:hypothetical protein
MHMHEQRRVRFASIDGIARADLPLAIEIWIDELSKKNWMSRDALKFATYLGRYMLDPDPKNLTLRSIERHTQLDRKQVLEVLKLMHTYGAAEAFDIDADAVRASLSLSLLQRLRTLETKRRFAELGADVIVEAEGGHIRKEGKWLPERTEEAHDDEVPPKRPGGSIRAA